MYDLKVYLSQENWEITLSVEKPFLPRLRFFCHIFLYMCINIQWRTKESFKSWLPRCKHHHRAK